MLVECGRMLDRLGSGVFGLVGLFFALFTVLTIFGSFESMASFARTSFSLRMNTNHLPCWVFMVGYKVMIDGSASSASMIVLLLLSFVVATSSVIDWNYHCFAEELVLGGEDSFICLW